MKTYRLHTFFVPVYRELLPDDWRGEADPRAPRLLLRGPTLGEMAGLYDRSVSQAAKVHQMELLRETVAFIAPMVLRCVGDWSLAGSPAAGLEGLELSVLADLMEFLMQAGRPSEETDAAPLDAGPDSSGEAAPRSAA